MHTEAVSRKHPIQYDGPYAAPRGSYHPRSYKPPKERKNDGTMLLREHHALPPKRVRGPEWMQPDGKRTRTIPNIHPQGYTLPKGRKDDGTMLVRVNGANSEPVRVPIPDNFRMVPVAQLERQPRSRSAKTDGPVELEAWTEYYRRENGDKQEAA